MTESDQTKLETDLENGGSKSIFLMTVHGQFNQTRPVSIIIMIQSEISEVFIQFPV